MDVVRAFSFFSGKDYWRDVLLSVIPGLSRDLLMTGE
jgi:hypothetical protein